MSLSRFTFYDPAPASPETGELLTQISAICEEFEC